jgi:tricorn protease-like protein
VKRILMVGVAALCVAAPHAVFAETLEDVAAQFGARESVLGVSLSPSGTKLAYIAPGGPSTEVVYVADLRTGAAPRAITTYAEANSDVVGCDWATDDRLICTVHYIETVEDVLLGVTRLFAMGADGSDPIMLTARQRGRAVLPAGRRLGHCVRLAGQSRQDPADP